MYVFVCECVYVNTNSKNKRKSQNETSIDLLLFCECEKSQNDAGCHLGLISSFHDGKIIARFVWLMKIRQNGRSPFNGKIILFTQS